MLNEGLTSLNFHSTLKFNIQHNYSVLKLFTGFAFAALID
jgi:hypothetical protein